MTSSGAKRMEGHLETPSQGTAEKYPDAAEAFFILEFHDAGRPFHLSGRPQYDRRLFGIG